jgi:glucosamine--fructose-6-phosphate aminotransferase (isomerizing)
MMLATHTWEEISSQAAVWRATSKRLNTHRAALEPFLSGGQFRRGLVVGCGSTHYLAQSAAATLTQRGGLPSVACPSSEVWLFPGQIPGERTLLLAVSRSGSTTETLHAVDRFRQRGHGQVIAITCYPESPLALQADLTLVAPDGQEQSVAQTRSFTSMLILSQALTATLANDEPMFEALHCLGDRLSELEARVGDLPQRLADDGDIKSIFFLGGGPLYGIANEAMLKTKEMSLAHAEAYHPLEFRHGPMSTVNRNTLVVGLLSDAAVRQEIGVLAHMQRLGAQVLALVEDGTALEGWRPEHLIELRSGMDEWARPPLYLPALQRLAFFRALANGLDPDRPTNLEAVITL